MIDFYEELFSLICTLTSKQISDNMWSILFLIYDIFQNDAADYFTELMPVLHNYVMVDTGTFLADGQRVEVVIKMIKQVRVFVTVTVLVPIEPLFSCAYTNVPNIRVNLASYSLAKIS